MTRYLLGSVSTLVLLGALVAGGPVEAATSPSASSFIPTSVSCPVNNVVPEANVIAHQAPGSCAIFNLAPGVQAKVYTPPAPVKSLGAAPSYTSGFHYTDVQWTNNQNQGGGYELDVVYEWTCSTDFGEVLQDSIYNPWTSLTFYWETSPYIYYVAATGAYPTVDSKAVLGPFGYPLAIDQNLAAATGQISWWTESGGQNVNGSVNLGC